MIEGKRVLAVIPARGGSKGVPLKNIQLVQGVPLVARVGNIIKNVPYIDRAIVSTDHPEIAKIAREAGLDVPFMRPLELSGDRVADWPVLVHALQELEKLDGLIYDIIVMLQPTSPMRKARHVKETIEKLVEEQLDSVWTVSETDSKAHPLKQLKITNGKIEYYDNAGNQIIARQQLEPLYHRNGVAYAMTRECILEQQTIKGKKTSPLIIEGIMVSIDTLWDFQLVEFLLNEESK
ncbi:MAG: acylneuraminate cytidylyltransferase family protein [Cyanobacteria bacterium P01_E01_bin.42]